MATLLTSLVLLVNELARDDWRGDEPTAESGRGSILVPMATIRRL